MIELTITPAQNGAAKVTASFTDEEGTAVAPTSIKWSLSSMNGTVVNERSYVAITPPAASVEWLLSGLDLAIGSYGERRLITIDAKYNSTLGMNIPLRAQAKFLIEHFAIVAPE